MEPMSATENPRNRRSPGRQEVTVNLTINASGLVTQETLDLINRAVEEAIAQALDEARRLQSDVKR